MDSNRIAGLLGAIATLVAVIVGAAISSHSSRRKAADERRDLACALLTELDLVCFDAISCAEIVRRSVEQKSIPTHSAFIRYLPHSPHMYRTLGGRLVELGPETARFVVEFYGELDKIKSRMDRILTLGKRATKKSKLESLESARSNWTYLLSCGVRALQSLAGAAQQKFVGELRESVNHRVDSLSNFGKPGAYWYLPDEEFLMRLPDEDLEE